MTNRPGGFDIVTHDTPSSVSKARGEIPDVIIWTARPESVIIGLANQIDSASVCPSEADWQLPISCGGRFHRRTLLHVAKYGGVRHQRALRPRCKCALGRANERCEIGAALGRSLRRDRLYGLLQLVQNVDQVLSQAVLFCELDSGLDPRLIVNHRRKGRNPCIDRIAENSADHLFIELILVPATFDRIGDVRERNILLCLSSRIVPDWRRLPNVNEALREVCPPSIRCRPSSGMIQDEQMARTGLARMHWLACSLIL